MDRQLFLLLLVLGDALLLLLVAGVGLKVDADPVELDVDGDLAVLLAEVERGVEGCVEFFLRIVFLLLLCAPLPPRPLVHRVNVAALQLITLLLLNLLRQFSYQLVPLLTVLVRDLLLWGVQAGWLLF